MSEVADAAVTRAAVTRKDAATEHVDVLIVGAGISGIGAAYHLSKQCVGTRFLVLEAKPSFGGTWLTHRYPGIRSDSDLFTFGYRFKPWTGKPIATGAEIRDYLGEVIDDNGLAPHIRYGHTIVAAAWSSDDNRWRITARRADTGDTVQIRANFLWMCQGYYRHAQGYTPDFPGMARFRGRIVHPQTWPDDLDYAGKRVIVIGSGATAATLVPAIAADCAHVAVVQRSPTYFMPGRNQLDLADTLRDLDVDAAAIHEIVRRKILKEQAAFTRRAMDEPDAMRHDLLAAVRACLGIAGEMEPHFTPTYRPWQQRVAFVPDGDLFRGIRSGKVTMHTDEIASFTETGLELKSGQRLDADIIVTATGFNFSVLGDVAFSIDGKPLDFAATVTYRGMMFTGVPNMVWVFGYFRAAWTLRVELVADFVCRLLNHMKAKGARRVVPALRPEDRDMPLLPWIDPDDFNPGYLMRALHLLPKRGDKPEWRHSQDYWAEKDQFPAIKLDDPAFVYA